MMSSNVLNNATDTTFEFIYIDDNGNAVIPQDKIIPLANYIAQLEALNKNYLEQIHLLEQMVSTYEEKLYALTKELEQTKAQLQPTQQELEKTKYELSKYKTNNLLLSIVAIISAGSVIYIFVKGG